jgi:hypothetical protein
MGYSSTHWSQVSIDWVISLSACARLPASKQSARAGSAGWLPLRWSKIFWSFVRQIKSQLGLTDDSFSTDNYCRDHVDGPG